MSGKSTPETRKYTLVIVPTGGDYSQILPDDGHRDTGTVDGLTDEGDVIPVPTTEERVILTLPEEQPEDEAGNGEAIEDYGKLCRENIGRICLVLADAGIVTQQQQEYALENDELKNLRPDVDEVTLRGAIFAYKQRQLEEDRMDRPYGYSRAS